MAVTIDWLTFVINVPKADLTLVQASPTEIRQLNLNTFRLELKSIEDSEDGMAFTKTHDHVAPISLGGVSLARVIEILEPYTVTFEDGQYAVNLVGANTNLGDRVNVNQVSVRTSNSAGLTYSKEVEDQSFADARVWVDLGLGQPGTAFPIGTPGTPVDNLVDAQSIVTQRSLPERMNVIGFVTVGAVDLSDYNIEGSGQSITKLTFSGTSVDNANFFWCLLTGTATGLMEAHTCELKDFSGFLGSAYECGLHGTITLGSAGGPNEYVLSDCLSHVPGTARPILDYDNIADAQMSIRRYTGGLEIRNMTGGSCVTTVDGASAKVYLHSSCTAGTFVMRGEGQLIDPSNGSVITTGTHNGITVYNETVVERVWDRDL